MIWPTDTHPLWVDLVDAGLVVTNDPARLSPPCVLLLPTAATQPSACGAEVTYSLHALAPGPEQAGSMRWLWETAAPILLRHCEDVTLAPWNDYPGLYGESNRQEQ